MSISQDFDETTSLLSKKWTIPEETTTTTLVTDSESLEELETPHPNRWSIIPSLWCGAFLAALDSTVVASTYAIMGSDLGDSSKASWIATSYMLSSTALQPLYGGLSDIFGRKNALLCANTLFLIGSLGCSISTSMPQLIIARVVAGLGGAGLGTLSSIVVSDLVPLSERSIYNGFANLVYGFGQVIGAPIGGYLADSVGWRFAFLIQCPITLISVIVIKWKVTIPVSYISAKPSFRNIDFIGSGLLIVAIVSLLYVLQLAGSDYALSSPAITGTIIISMISFNLFFYAESKVKNPIVLLNVILSRNPLLSGLTNFFGYMGSFAIMFNVPLFLQVVVGESASLAGSRLITYVIGMCFGSLTAGAIIRYTQRYYHTIISGVLFEIFGSITISTLQKSSPSWKYQLYMFPGGIGHGFILSASLMAVISSVGREEQAKATSVSYLFRVFGGAFGISLTASVNNFFLRNELNKAFSGIENKTELISSILNSISIINKLPPHLATLAQNCYDNVIHKTFYLIILVQIISACFAIFIKEYPLSRQ